MDKNNTKREVFSADARLTYSATAVPVKFTTADGKDGEKIEAKRTLKGYPIVWGVLSTDRGGYKVRLEAGSATFTTPCLALYHHEFRDLLGNTANGSLRILPADDYGIPVEIDLPNTTTANDVAELVGEQYINGMSFSMCNGFEESSQSDENGQTVLTVTKFTCDEVTVTVIPAFAATSVEVSEDNDYDDKDDEDDDEIEKISEYQKEHLSQSLKVQKSRLYLLDQ
jgi:HK97 family phage prohead protease